VVNMAMRQLMRQLWTGIAAATVAGLLSAVIMRAVAHLVNGIPQFSLGGSAFIALVYIVCLLPMSAVRTSRARRRPPRHCARANPAILRRR
jgi:hypothetical protein